MLKRLFALCVVSVAIPLSASAQWSNNSYSDTIIRNNAAQQSLNRQMFPLGGGYTGGTPSNWCSPRPPVALQRGMDGHVPPELQGDPRYQAWLRCQQGR
jgi:hypothetical protein